MLAWEASSAAGHRPERLRGAATRSSIRTPSKSPPRKRAPAAPAEARTRATSSPASPGPGWWAVHTERGLSVLVYAGLFPFLLYLYGDLDWGWHLRYGEYLLTHGRI